MRTQEFSRRRLLRSALMLGGLSATGLLAACGGGTASPTTAPAKDAAAPAAKPADTAAKPADAAKPTAATKTDAAVKPAAGTAERVVIRDHDWLQPGDWYDGFIAQWEEENPNIKVEREWIARAEMHTKLMALAATNQIGDTVRINVAPLVTEMQLKGVLHDLDSLYRGDQEWVENDLPEFWPGNLQTYTRDGKLWGLPLVGHPGCLQYYVNTSLVEKAGVQPPPADGNWTYDDFIELSKALTQDTGSGRIDQYGALMCVGNEGVVAHLRAFGGDMFDADGRTCLINTPESKAGLQAMADMWQVHEAAMPWAANLVPQELFHGEKVGIAILTSFAAASWPDVVSFEMDVFPNPLGSTGKHASQVSSDGKGVAMATQHPAEAWTVLSRLFTSQEHGLNRFLNGLGSPGSRFDVWDSDEFKTKAPKLANIANVLVLPPAPDMTAWHHPANGRYFEADTAANNILQRVWLGEIEADAGAEEVYTTVQAIMDQPPV